MTGPAQPSRLASGCTAAVLSVPLTAAEPAAEPAADRSYPDRVLLIRHAEKPPDDAMSASLSPQGQRRAQALPELFRKSAAHPNPLPTPEFIFATKNSKHSHRPVETVTPLARALGLALSTDIADEDFARLAAELLGKPKYAGKTVLVCWHHGTLPELARKLGAADAPDHFKGSAFDRVWQITYDARGRAAFQDLPQRLLPGDSTK